MVANKDKMNSITQVAGKYKGNEHDKLKIDYRKAVPVIHTFKNKEKFLMTNYNLRNMQQIVSNYNHGDHVPDLEDRMDNLSLLRE